MKYLKQFTIPFSGYKLGKHRLDFKIDRKFFEHFKTDEYSDADISVDVEMNKQNSLLEFNIVAKGEVEVDCDRCGDPLRQKVKTENILFVKFGDEFIDEGEDVVVIPSTEHEYNIGQYLFENLQLSVPSRRIHPAGKCNKEALKKLEELSLKKEEKEIDPRWGALKNIKLN